jgi:hypothetical protein
MTASTPEQHAAYRAGLCVALCGRPHSAGRPRCDECHTDYTAAGHQEVTVDA